MKTVINSNLFPLILHIFASFLVQDEYHSTSTKLVIDDELKEVRIEFLDEPPVVLFAESYYW